MTNPVKEQWKASIRQALAHAGALPLDVQQLEAIASLFVPSVISVIKYRSDIRLNLLSDAAQMLPKLTGQNLTAYAKTFAVLAQAEVDKDNS